MERETSCLSTRTPLRSKVRAFKLVARTRDCMGCPLYHDPEYGSSIAQTACIAGTSRDSCLNSCSLTPRANAQSTSTNSLNSCSLSPHANAQSTSTSSLQPAALTNYVYPIHSTDSKFHSLTHTLTNSHASSRSANPPPKSVHLRSKSLHKFMIHLTRLTQALLPPLNRAPVCSTNLRHKSLH